MWHQRWAMFRAAACILLLLAGSSLASVITMMESDMVVTNSDKGTYKFTTGELLQFLGDSVSLKYFPRASANCTDCYLSFKLGALVELDAFGQPIASHSIPDLSLLVPEIAGGQRMSGVTTYEYVTMTFTAPRLPASLTQNNCPSLESIINQAYSAGIGADNSMMAMFADQAAATNKDAVVQPPQGVIAPPGRRLAEVPCSKLQQTVPEADHALAAQLADQPGSLRMLQVSPNLQQQAKERAADPATIPSVTAPQKKAKVQTAQAAQPTAAWSDAQAPEPLVAVEAKQAASTSSPASQASAAPVSPTRKQKAKKGAAGPTAIPSVTAPQKEAKVQTAQAASAQPTAAWSDAQAPSPLVAVEAKQAASTSSPASQARAAPVSPTRKQKAKKRAAGLAAIPSVIALQKEAKVQTAQAASVQPTAAWLDGQQPLAAVDAKQDSSTSSPASQLSASPAPAASPASVLQPAAVPAPLQMPSAVGSTPVELAVELAQAAFPALATPTPPAAPAPAGTNNQTAPATASAPAFGQATAPTMAAPVAESTQAAPTPTATTPSPAAVAPASDASPANGGLPAAQAPAAQQTPAPATAATPVAEGTPVPTAAALPGTEATPVPAAAAPATGTPVPTVAAAPTAAAPAPAGTAAPDTAPVANPPQTPDAAAAVPNAGPSASPAAASPTVDSQPAGAQQTASTVPDEKSTPSSNSTEPSTPADSPLTDLQPGTAPLMQPGPTIVPSLQPSFDPLTASEVHQQLQANGGYLTTDATAGAAMGLAMGGAAGAAYPYGFGFDSGPVIKVTFMFGFSNNKTFPYGRGRIVSAPAGSIKFNIEAQNWPFCSLYNTLKLEVVMASPVKDSQPQFVMGGDTGGVEEEIRAPISHVSRRLQQGEAYTDFMEPDVSNKKAALGLGGLAGSPFGPLGSSYAPFKSVNTAKMLVGPNLAAAIEYPTYAFSSDKFTSESNVSLALSTNTKTAARFSLTFGYFEQGLFYDPTIYFSGSQDMLVGVPEVPVPASTAPHCSLGDGDCLKPRRRVTAPTPSSGQMVGTTGLTVQLLLSISSILLMALLL